MSIVSRLRHSPAGVLAASFAFCSVGCAPERQPSGDGAASAGRSAQRATSADSKTADASEDAARATQAGSAGDDTVRLAQLSGAPASCAQADLLARLLPADAQDCGDLPLGATQEERDKSYECARKALSGKRAFRVFWRVQGIDSVPHRGFIGRFEGDERELFRLDVDADWYGIDFVGATASWTRCEIPPTNAQCALGPAECFGCYPIEEPLTCGCLPEGPRPGGEVGSAVELRCMPYGT